MDKIKRLGYRLCRAIGLFRLAKWLTSGHLTILCYHGFALDDECDFRPKLFMPAATFEARLEIIRRYGFRVVPLDMAIDALYSGNLPPNSLVITIDDGFYSTYRIAAPLLHKHQYPATVYVTSYYVVYPHAIFRLAIQYMFWKTRKESLELKNEVWSEDGRIDLTDPVQKERAVWTCIHYGETQCSEAERRAISCRVGTLVDVPYEALESSRILNLMRPAELRELVAAGIDVQLHTHRHVFPEDDLQLAEREIADNRSVLQQFLGGAVLNHFCYPSGLWSEHHWDLLERMHIRSATTCMPGLNSAATPRHALRRFLDGGNIDQVEFEAAICGFSALIRGQWNGKLANRRRNTASGVATAG